MNEKCTVRPTEGESTPQYKKKIFYEHRPAEAYFPSYGLLKIKENAQGVHLELITQQVARLCPDFLTGHKIPGVVLIISDPFCIICCSRPWVSLTVVA